MKIQLTSPLVGLAIAAFLAGCSGDDGSASGTSRMKLSVTDAPVDGAQEVVVKFTGVELRAEGRDPILITFTSPKTIDLLNDSGTASAVLFDEPLPAGSYNQIRLDVVADGDPADSYITLEDGTRHGLRVPSGSQSGLKLVSGYQLPSGGVANFTIDFDLRKAITCPPGQNDVCLLKPALRLVADNSVGAVQGVVSASLVPEGCSPGVYIYSGTVTSPEDIDSTDSSGEGQPIASKVPTVSSTSGGGFGYQVGFLTPGSYTIAFTCQADDDDSDADDADVVFDEVISGITVTAGQTTASDFN